MCARRDGNGHERYVPVSYCQLGSRFGGRVPPPGSTHFQGASTAEAAQIAALPRAVFIEQCLDNQVALDGPDDDWLSGLERAATALGAKLPRLDDDG